MDNNNRIAQVLYIFGVLQIVLGVIIGILLADTEVQGYYGSYSEFSWPIFWVSAISGTVSGVLLVGFSEIINLLNKIYNTITPTNPPTIKEEQNEENE